LTLGFKNASNTSSHRLARMRKR